MHYDDTLNKQGLSYRADVTLFKGGWLDFLYETIPALPGGTGRTGTARMKLQPGLLVHVCQIKTPYICRYYGTTATIYTRDFRQSSERGSVEKISCRFIRRVESARHYRGDVSLLFTGLAFRSKLRCVRCAGRTAEGCQSR